jgi:hypothetical protein
MQAEWNQENDKEVNEAEDENSKVEKKNEKYDERSYGGGTKPETDSLGHVGASKYERRITLTSPALKFLKFSAEMVKFRIRNSNFERLHSVSHGTECLFPSLDSLTITP